MAKKTYKVVNFHHKEYAEAAAEVRGGGARIDRPLTKIDGPNEGLLAEMFTLPDVREHPEATVEVAYRILGFPVTEKLLNHLPTNVNSEHVGMLLPYMPFAIHRRFGVNWTDYICPDSVRSCRCSICLERIRLFRSDDYKTGKLHKDDIIKEGGFGTQMKALFFAQIYIGDKLLPVAPVVVTLTNEKIGSAHRDNFFDKIDILSTPKKLMTSEVLPRDYYADGDGARWIVAEYNRATYPGGTNAFWKLGDIGCTKDLAGVGAAADIWWPEVGKKDGAEVVDVYQVLNVPDKDTLEAEAVDKVKHLNSIVSGPQAEEVEEDHVGDGGVEATDGLTWQDIIDADLTDLVAWGVSKGGDGEKLALVGEANPAALRRNVAKLFGVVPTRVAPQDASKVDEEDYPPY